MNTQSPKPAREIAPFTLSHADDASSGEVEALYNLVFGPGRFAKTAERLREGNHRIDEACHIARDEHGLVGAVQFWPVTVGENGRGVLLGPLAIAPRRRGDGIAFKLMETGIAICAEQGWPAVILVGDEPYYARAGFQRTEPGRFTMPGPVNASRILMRELSDEAAALRGPLSVPRATTPAS